MVYAERLVSPLRWEMDPYCALWCVFLWELPQMRFTEKQLNKRLASHELTSVARECSRLAKRVFNCFSVQPHAGAPKRKLAIECNMGFYGRQFAIRSTTHTHTHTHMHTHTLSHTHAERGAPREAREVRRQTHAFSFWERTATHTRSRTASRRRHLADGAPCS